MRQINLMSNDKAQMTNEIQMTKGSNDKTVGSVLLIRYWYFVIHLSFEFCYLTFPCHLAFTSSMSSQFGPAFTDTFIGTLKETAPCISRTTRDTSVSNSLFGASNKSSSWTWRTIFDSSFFLNNSSAMVRIAILMMSLAVP